MEYSHLAVTGFVLSLVGLGLVGLPVSVLALGGVERGKKRGSGLAVAGLALGSLTALPNVILVFLLTIKVFVSTVGP